MPTIPLQYCAEPGCSERVLRGRCTQHAQDVERGRPNIDLRRLYRTSQWGRLRSLVLQEEPLCMECQQEGFIVPSNDVHHKQKATLDNFFDRSNLQALCVKHHSRHTRRGE